MMFTIGKLQPDLSFGVVVNGLKPEDLISEEVRKSLRGEWYRSGLIIFRGQPVTSEFQIALSEVFAACEVHQVREIRHPDNDKLIRLVSNPQGDDDDLIEVDGETGCAWLPWHKDVIFTAGMNHGGLLRATKITSRGGQTGFIDQIDAYARLSDAMKARIEGLEIIYKYGPVESSPWCAREQVTYLKKSWMNRSMDERAARDWPSVVHPLVFVQPQTGRKILNLSPRFAQGVLGWDKAESDTLLTELCNHVWDSPAYFHSWQLDDMVLWDNWRMLHCVTPGPVNEVRIVERTTIQGDYGMGRVLETA